MRSSQLLYIFIFILLVLSGMSLAEEDTWTKKADMPTARGFLSTSELNGTIYAIGGWDGTRALSTVEEYDPMTDTWTRKADMLFPKNGLSTSVVNGKIYAIGGADGSPAGGAGATYSNVVEEYDPVADTWTRKADMPTSRMGLSTSVVNGVIYAIGGYWGGVAAQKCKLTTH
jgi:N-acetylneuraminic acid mutarotase